MTLPPPLHCPLDPRLMEALAGNFLGGCSPRKENPPRRARSSVGNAERRRQDAIDYSQFASKTGSTRARHASSAPERPPRTLMAKRAEARAGTVARRGGDPCARRAAGLRLERRCLRTAARRRLRASAPAEQPSRGRRGRPAPSPQPDGAVITRTFPGSFSFRSWGQGSGKVLKA